MKVLRTTMAAAVCACLLAAAPASATRPTASGESGCRGLPALPLQPRSQICAGFSLTSLYDVAAVSKNSVWAVGDRETRNHSAALVQHWDGTSWTDGSPVQVGQYDQLYAVDASSDSDVWAVGVDQDDVDTQGLVEHWDGSVWSVQSVPGDLDAVWSVSVESRTNAWAVGTSQTARGKSRPRILHWDGARWNVVASPRPDGVDSVLSSIAVTSSDDVWAAGYRQVRTGERALLEHWEGDQWQIVDTPDAGEQNTALLGTRGFGDDQAWAGGTHYKNPRHTRTAIERSDHSGAWHQVAPPADAKHAEVADITGTSKSDVWLVGFATVPLTPLTLHWDGQHLVRVADADKADGALLTAADSLAKDDVWAVGYYFANTHPLRVEALHQHWDGRRWVNS